MGNAFFKNVIETEEQIWDFLVKGGQKDMTNKCNSWPQTGYSPRGKNAVEDILGSSDKLENGQ